MMLIAILLKTCFSRLILGFYQAYTRLSKSRGGLLRGRKAPAVPRGRDVPGGFWGEEKNPSVPRGKRLFRGANYIHPRGGSHGLPGIYGREGEIFRMKWQKFLFFASFLRDSSESLVDSGGLFSMLFDGIPGGFSFYRGLRLPCYRP